MARVKGTSSWIFIYDGKSFNVDDVIQQSACSAANVDYNRTSCTGRCDDYCRCTQIIDAHVDKVNMNELENLMVEGVQDSFLRYCGTRLLSIFKFYQPDNWEPDIGRGYYGEELNGATYTGDVVAFKNAARDIWNAPDNNSRIELILELEYGYLLDAAKNKNWNIVKIERSQVRLGVDDHYRRIDPAVVKRYKDYEYPVGVVIDSGNGPKLIDGYHRFKATEGKDMITVVYGEDK